MYESYVAIGDSFTEGLDDRRPDGTFRGWADLVAARLAATTPGFRYANLAVRGRRMAHVLADQLPRAESLRPELLTVAAGGNDIIGFRCQVPELGRAMHEVLERLVATGGTVLVFTGFNAQGRLPFGRLLAGRAAEYNASVLASAEQLGVLVVDLWQLTGLYQDRMWAQDRLHLSTAGHALVAAGVLTALDVAGDHGPGHDPDEAEVRARWLAARRADVDWARTYFAPWVGRKVRGRSSGDLLDAKLPELGPVAAAAGPDEPAEVA